MMKGNLEVIKKEKCAFALSQNSMLFTAITFESSSDGYIF